MRKHQSEILHILLIASCFLFIHFGNASAQDIEQKEEPAERIEVREYVDGFRDYPWGSEFSDFLVKKTNKKKLGEWHYSYQVDDVDYHITVFFYGGELYKVFQYIDVKDLDSTIELLNSIADVGIDVNEMTSGSTILVKVWRVGDVIISYYESSGKHYIKSVKNEYANKIKEEKITEDVFFRFMNDYYVVGNPDLLPIGYYELLTAKNSVRLFGKAISSITIINQVFRNSYGLDIDVRYEHWFRALFTVLYNIHDYHKRNYQDGKVDKVEQEKVIQDSMDVLATRAKGDLQAVLPFIDKFDKSLEKSYKDKYVSKNK